MRIYILKFIFISIDVIVFIGLFYLTLFIRKSINGMNIPRFDELLLQDFSFVIFIAIALMYYEKIYTLRYDFWQETHNIVKSLFLAYIITLALLTISKTNLEYSRLFISIYFLLALFVVPIIKRITKYIFYSFSFFKRKILLVGNKEQVDIFKNEFEKNWYFGVTYSTNHYNMVIIASKGMSNNTINEMISKHMNEKCELYIVPYITDLNFSNSNILEYSNIRHNTIQIENKLLIKRNIYIKNIFEIIITLLLIPIFMLSHLIISIAIKLDSKGPIFFKQPRLGKNDNDFICYKYRTMYQNSDKLLKQYLEENPNEVSYYEEFHKYQKDPRITRVGKILRSTSLDELAQVINVLKGEMSLIGPRPYMINEAEKLANDKEMILKVKPGITGLWQVSGRNNLTFKERNVLEVWYIKNWSLWSDFVILIKTIKVVLSKVGAK